MLERWSECVLAMSRSLCCWVHKESWRWCEMTTCIMVFFPSLIWKAVWPCNALGWAVLVLLCFTHVMLCCLEFVCEMCHLARFLEAQPGMIFNFFLVLFYESTYSSLVLLFFVTFLSLFFVYFNFFHPFPVSHLTNYIFMTKKFFWCSLVVTKYIYIFFFFCTK